MNKPTVPMELTAENVRAVVTDAIFRDEEISGGPPSDYIEGDGILRRFGFHPERLESHREDVHSMLQQLGDDFKAEAGGGASFLNMCIRADGVHWAEQSTCADLCALGTALGLVSFPLPREVWGALPGGVPYVTIHAAEAGSKNA